MLTGTTLAQSGQADYRDTPSPLAARAQIQAQLQEVVDQELSIDAPFELVEVDRIRLHSGHVEIVAWGLIDADDEPLMLHLEVDLSRESLRPRRWLVRQINGSGVLVRLWSSEYGALILAAN